MSYSMDIYNRIVSFLHDDDWKFDFDEQREVIKMGVSLKCKLKSTRVLIDLRDDKYIVYSTVPLNADDDCKAEMARLLNRINWTLIFGCFEMDESDGEIRFRMPVSCKGNCWPTREVIKESILVPVLMVEKFGNAIAQVLMGMCDAETAYLSMQKKD